MVQVWTAEKKSIFFLNCHSKKNFHRFPKTEEFFFWIFCRLFLCKLIICLPLALSREHSLFEFNGMWWLIASEARKAVGLSRSLAIPQLRVCVYECIWRHYHYKKYIHGPRKLSPSHVRDNNIVQRAGQQYHSTCGRLPFWRISLGVK